MECVPKVVRTLLLAGFACVAAAHAQVSQAERETRWRQDLQVLRTGFGKSGYTVDLQRGISTRGQKDFSKLYPEASFDAEMKAIQADIPKISDAEVVLRLMRLVASAKVAHNVVQMPIGLGFFSRLPLNFYWYPDGLAVVGAAAGYSAAIGARVLTIGTMTPEQLLAAIAPYIPHENGVWLRQQAPEFIRPRAVLRHFGLIDSDGRVNFTLQKPDGQPFQLAVEPADPRLPRLSLAETLRVPVPGFRSRPGESYWRRYLDVSQTLFIQYNKCWNDPKLPFAEFARRVFAEADGHPVKRVVIDMRQNGGGDSRVIDPLANGLAARLKNVGQVYVLIGPMTFSSAVDNAMQLRHRLRATLVGEATGGKPGHYGEVKYLTLPNSKLVVQYTTKHFGRSDGTEPTVLQPDLAVPLTLADALAGRDPALRAVIAAKR